MRTLTTGLMIAGAALFVAACGGGAANNTANAVSNEPAVMNEPTTAPDMNSGMPADNNAMAAPAPAMDANAAAPANTTNAM